MRRRTILATLAVCVTGGAAVAIWAVDRPDPTPLAQRAPNPILGSRLGEALTLPHIPAKTFRRLGLPARTELVGSFDRRNEDGMTPETFGATLHSLDGFASLQTHYRRACAALGLEPALPTEMEPHRVCTGRDERTPYLELIPCQTTHCTAYLQMHAY